MMEFSASHEKGIAAVSPLSGVYFVMCTIEKTAKLSQYNGKFPPARGVPINWRVLLCVKKINEKITKLSQNDWNFPPAMNGRDWRDSKECCRKNEA